MDGLPLIPSPNQAQDGCVCVCLAENEIRNGKEKKDREERREKGDAGV